MVIILVHTKRLFVEITTIKEEIDDIKLYNIIKKNIPISSIKIYSFNKVKMKDL